jgi:hypothetical protein
MNEHIKDLTARQFIEMIAGTYYELSHDKVRIQRDEHVRWAKEWLRTHPEEAVQEEDLVYRLRKRAEIRRSIATRKSVQNNEPDRIADLLEEAADEMEKLRYSVLELKKRYKALDR